MSFSVLTVTKRTGWEEIGLTSIERQTIKPDKWVIVTEQPLSIVVGDVETVIVQAPPQTRLSNLNASLNRGLQKINSEYAIFYQDFIDLQEDCFEKLLSLATPKTFVTTCTPNYDGSDDGRYTGINVPRPCRPEEWEANVAIAPMQMLKELGGFDEEYDNGWSWDNVNVAQRAAMLGARFILDESNRPKLHRHEQTSHQTLPLNMKRHADTMKAIRSGQKPLKLNYL